jgi:hypothetical protein
MFHRLSVIINELGNLGDKVSEKILLSLVLILSPTKIRHDHYEMWIENHHSYQVLRDDVMT